MDAVEPELIEEAEEIITQLDGVLELRRVRMRWVGHRLHAEICIAVDPRLTMAQGHEIAEEGRHALFHQIDSLSDITIHVDPWLKDDQTGHEMTMGHEPVPQLVGD